MCALACLNHKPEQFLTFLEGSFKEKFRFKDCAIVIEEIIKSFV